MEIAIVAAAVFAFVFAVLAVVAIVAIVYGRRFAGHVEKGRASMEIDVKDRGTHPRPARQ